MRKVKWGILSTAKIGTKNVIPSMQRSELCDIVAISSRKLENARNVAEELEIPKYYGSYEELLADEEIEAIYNPLPNHLHVPWTIKALEAGKHVLCEKPIAITADEAAKLMEATKKFPDLKVMEAFMYRFHPQWDKVREIIDSGEIGDLRSVHSVFTYYNIDPENVRNKADIGGGGLLDIGCYCINMSRLLYNDEPSKVTSFVEYDPDFNVDRFASGILEFEQGIATFTCSTQLYNDQYAIVTGTKGKLELNIPFNAPNEHLRKIRIESESRKETLILDTCDQYILQGDAFSKAIILDTPVPTPLSDSLANMKVIDAMFTNAK
ncbi:MAG TPA: NAD-binding protein [Balneolaceae bacterium]|nr:NAD-binding protein [Balneolaceae bacterium]|tara:strand:+ start:218563 stop:219531 length:969 start_codon:yes stop_codon:yes gene_type:complete